MEQTPTGTPVGVDDLYAVAGVCDHLTSDGRCRLALRHSGVDPDFAAERAADEYACHVGEAGDWQRCQHYRWTTSDTECARCGLEEVRLAHDSARPLLEEHHLSYGESERADSDTVPTSHEITVSLCRWCHAKVHRSFARIDDDASPDPDAIAERETRRVAEQQEFGFQSARRRSEE